ncbi:MAG: ORF6N domain-containing protein [Adlercreutzia equolifaciens]
MADDLISAIAGTDLTKLIHVIRGQHVMVDCDLAALYGVETKVFNQAVKRNIARFPEHFRFQLTQEEYDNLRSQIVTSSWGGRRYPPYVFTEQGVAMLSAVLRSATAIEVSIGIMDAFVRMRQFLHSNAALLEKGSALEFSLLNIKTAPMQGLNGVWHIEASARFRIKDILQRGDVDAFALLVDLINPIAESLMLVDGYVDVNTLNILSKRKGVAVGLVTLPSARLTTPDAQVFESQYGPLSIVRTADFHDRFLVIDRKAVYHIGASLKDAGKKTFAVVLIDDDEIVQNLLDRIDDLVKKR